MSRKTSLLAFCILIIVCYKSTAQTESHNYLSIYSNFVFSEESTDYYKITKHDKPHNAGKSSGIMYGHVFSSFGLYSKISFGHSPIYGTSFSARNKGTCISAGVMYRLYDNNDELELLPYIGVGYSTISSIIHDDECWNDECDAVFEPSPAICYDAGVIMNVHDNEYGLFLSLGISTNQFGVFLSTGVGFSF